MYIIYYLLFKHVQFSEFIKNIKFIKKIKFINTWKREIKRKFKEERLWRSKGARPFLFSMFLWFEPLYLGLNRRCIEKKKIHFFFAFAFQVLSFGDRITKANTKENSKSELSGALFFFSKILRLSKNCTLMEFILIYLIFIYIRPVPFEHKTIFILFKIFLHMCVSFPTSIPFNLYSFHSIFKILCFQFYTQIPQRSHSFAEFHYIFPTLASYINA
jgi:hypothetical protein